MISTKGMSIIVLHGLWTRGLELFLLKRRLERAGLGAYIYSYPTVSRSFPENVKALARFIRKNTAGRVCLVGHSYGGLVACGLVSGIYDGWIEDIVVKKCVFLGSPLLGSSVARRLEHLAPFRLVTGKALGVLKSGCSLERGGPVKSVMIAGTLNVGFGMFMINGPGDGVVALSETKAPWLDGHYTVHVTHLGLVLSKEASSLCIDFLKT